MSSRACRSCLSGTMRSLQSSRFALIEAIAYAMGNPSAASVLASCAERRNGPAHQLGRMSWTVKRPELSLDQESLRWPDSATLQLSMSPLSLADAAVRDAVAQELERI